MAIPLERAPLPLQALPAIRVMRATGVLPSTLTERHLPSHVASLVQRMCECGHERDRAVASYASHVRLDLPLPAALRWAPSLVWEELACSRLARWAEADESRLPTG